MSPESPTPEEPPRRRPFEGAPPIEPFYRTPEFQRLIWLGGLLIVVGILGVYFAYRGQSADTGADASNTAQSGPPPLLTPDQVAERERRLVTRLEGTLNDSRNGEDFAETQGYCRLLQIVRDTPPDEFAAHVTRHLDYAAAMRDPDAWRGEYVWIRGVIAQMYTVKLRRPLFGITDVYQGILTEGDGTEAVFFDLPEPPPAFKMEPREAVDVQGVFYRTVRYESKDGKMLEAPYLVARSLRPVVNPRVTGTAGFLKEPRIAAWVAMGLAIFLTGLLVYVFQRRARRPGYATRAHSAGFRELFEKKLREEERVSGPRPPV